MNIELSEIGHDERGFVHLLDLHSQTKDCSLEDVTIDMSQVHWFSANMCAVFGALLYGLKDRLNNVALTNINSKVEDAFSNNGFLSHYGDGKILDYDEISISYNRFDIQDDRYFAEYIEKEFIHRAELPKMSDEVLKHFRKSILEIFSNAVLHSKTELGIFSCGQIFPDDEILTFTVADLGVGIPKTVNAVYNGNAMSAEQAIDWATEAGNTSKSGGVPGGLGLSMLRQLIGKNEGQIQIVSENGYWRQKDDGDVEKKALAQSFPGTIVSLEINTDDETLYRFEDEIKESNIF